MDGHLLFLGWAPTNPRIFTHQKNVNYILRIWHFDLTHCHVWSPAIPRMVIYFS